MYAVGTKRPNTGVVCDIDGEGVQRFIGRVTSQRRQRGERYWTATATMMDGSPAATTSLGTRLPPSRQRHAHCGTSTGRTLSRTRSGRHRASTRRWRISGRGLGVRPRPQGSRTSGVHMNPSYPLALDMRPTANGETVEWFLRGRRAGLSGRRGGCRRVHN